ncbi:MAG: hypothetical protein ACLPY1_06595 [Terracidiphilus sp.]
MRRIAQSRYIWLIAAFLVGATICLSQYRVLPGKLDADGLPTSSARICPGTSGTEHCYSPPSDKYAFGLEPRARTVGKLDGHDLILFTATFSGGGSGTLTNVALLEEQSCDFVNLLPIVQLTNQSEFRLWNLPDISNAPALATADSAWDLKAGETHFAPHRYTVNMYVFDVKLGRYMQRVGYVTASKYPGLDENDSIHVLDVERPTILARLRPGPG